jgi:hypothetical protein
VRKFSLAVLVLVLLALPAWLFWRARREPPQKPPDDDKPFVPSRDPKEPPRPADRGPLDANFVEASAAAEQPSVNLLRRPQALLVRTTAPPSEVGGLAALTDDSPSTVAVASAVKP